MRSPAKNPVTEYLADVPPDKRAALEKLRAVIKEAAPDAIESIGWSMPCYKYKGKLLVSFAAFKDHCSFTPMAPLTLLETYGVDISGYDTTKSMIRYPASKPLPDSFVKKVVKAKMKAIDDGWVMMKESPRFT